MYPGCSEYAAQAVREHGLLKGVTMGFDRLIRCGRDVHKYPSVWIDGVELHLDPVPPKPQGE